MRRIIAIVVVVMLPVLAGAPAGAASGPDSFTREVATPAESDHVTAEYDSGPIAQSALTEYSGDPLQIIVWPHDTRRYSLGTDQIGVFVCTWPGATAGINLTSATSILNDQVVPFYNGLSGGAYAPYFVARKTLTLDDHNSIWSDCENAMKAEAQANPHSDQGVIGILDDDSNQGKGTPGTYCYNCVNPVSTTFPGNGRWAIIEGGAVKSFGVYDAHITTAAHEVGHMISPLRPCFIGNSPIDL